MRLVNENRCVSVDGCSLFLYQIGKIILKKLLNHNFEKAKVRC